MNDQNDLIRRRWRTHKTLWALFAVVALLWVLGIVHEWTGFPLVLALIYLMGAPYSFDEEFTSLDDFKFTIGGLLMLASPFLIIGLLIYFGLR